MQQKTSECTQSDRQDPIPAIVDFNNQLKDIGITLYFMPVPPKALIYADKIDETVRADNSLYNHYNTFFEELQGVKVVDLFSVFTKAKTNGISVYCDYSGQSVQPFWSIVYNSNMIDS